MFRFFLMVWRGKIDKECLKTQLKWRNQEQNEGNRNEVDVEKRIEKRAGSGTFKYDVDMLVSKEDR